VRAPSADVTYIKDPSGDGWMLLPCTVEEKDDVEKMTSGTSLWIRAPSTVVLVVRIAAKKSRRERNAERIAWAERPE